MLRTSSFARPAISMRRAGKLALPLLLGAALLGALTLPVGIYLVLKGRDQDMRPPQRRLVVVTDQDGTKTTTPDVVRQVASPQVVREEQGETQRAPVKPAPAVNPSGPAPGNEIVATKKEATAREPAPRLPQEPGADPPLGPRTFTRLRHTTEDELARQLAQVPEAALDQVPNSSALLVKVEQARGNRDADLVPQLMAGRPDLRGLPIRKGADCRLATEPARNLQDLSLLLRGHLQASIPGIGAGTPTAPNTRLPPPDAAVLRVRLLNSSEKGKWLRAEAIPVLLQMLMASNVPTRQLLVELLAEIPGRQASLALAQRGLYDLDPEVRRSAANALANRPAREFQDLLIPAFQHPWPPIAQHAAELIAYLKLDELAPKLMPLLDMKNPMVAVKIEGDGPAQYLVTELVRINHLGNCMLCHATSSNTSDLVRGLVPVPGRPLSSPGSSSPYGGSVGTFVRADITYLKQDFSLEQPVRNPGAWPAEQRFDFLLRRRAVNNLEHTALLLAKNPRLADSFPQRDAVQHALTALGRVGAAPRAEGARTAADTEKLAADLVSAPLVQQESLLDKLAEREGDQVTRALALALPQLPETLWKKGRKLLAQRLVRLPVAELRGHLREGKDEMLRAAISAAGKSKGRGAVPDLVACLDQGDPDLLWSLRMSLFELTGQDFGPALDASAEQRQQVQVRWKAWLESQAR